ncbi:MAG: tRNA glutamyl-Q(34) synthetase GluQRS [Rhodospirillum sp.]|nr:tRNA glutamyl-Q(34) synthetase GluQRS [Rhodospirillum sp.]MCF8487540.1 tRNA glutamyl-Q(34) synthetase GluQRS [Rhodospirillum sp.]MCF8499023.1 tRNA glutamyl-Q(34) synthetase GluQRS [Rhodospirillum sp.]
MFPLGKTVHGPDALLVTRFAPSPTGALHLGHAFSAILAHDLARAMGGRFILRLEDIDGGRCRPEFIAGILDDLQWLGLTWDGPVLRQSERMALYRRHLDGLESQGLLYPCFCTRKDIQEEIARSPSAPQGPDGPLYPGTCRTLAPDERTTRLSAGEPHCLRLDMRTALKQVGPLTWTAIEERGRETRTLAQPEVFGDVVLARKDSPTSYHLAVTTDDAAQGVTLVVRGEDLRQATHVHRLLQALLDLPTPRYWHHRLLVDESGKRLAKRDRAMTLAALRESGETPQGVRRRIGSPLV